VGCCRQRQATDVPKVDPSHRQRVLRRRQQPDLAARLHISEKTAGHHVSAILAKLGVRSRREAARVAAEWQIRPIDGDPAPPR
jgi:hypothetical protein